MDVNKVIVMGNVGRDPDIRVFNDGNKIAQLSIATNEEWKDKTTGEKKKKTHWHNVVIKNNGTVDKFIEPYVHKGDRLYIEGRMETRKWTDQSGVEKYTTEIVVPMFGGVVTKVPNKFDQRDDAGQSQGADQGAQRNDLDDEIPF